MIISSPFMWSHLPGNTVATVTVTNGQQRRRGLSPLDFGIGQRRVGSHLLEHLHVFDVLVDELDAVLQQNGRDNDAHQQQRLREASNR